VLDRLAGRDQAGQQAVPEVLELVAAGGQLLQGVEQQAGAEGEHLGGHPGRGRLLGLVVEAAQAAVAGHLDHGLAGRLAGRDLGGDHRHPGPALAVTGQDLAVVEPVDVVGAEHQDDLGVVLGDQPPVAPDGVGVALVEAVLLGPELGREQPQPPVGPVEVPGPAVGQLVVERLEPVLLGHPDVLDPRVKAVGQREVDQPVHAGVG
jgi:hypothetical protein